MTMTLRFTPRRSRLALALALAAAVPAYAQSGPTSATDPRHDDAEELDRIVITANPLRSTAEQLSQPVEVLAGERLDEARAATLGETLTRLPGVQSSNFGSGVGRPIIRGLEGARVSVLSGGLSTQDVSTISQDHAVTIEPFLADQIEVLKGPATLLYGNGAIGGVVNVVDGRIAEAPLGQTIQGRAEARTETATDGFTGMARVDAAGAGGALVLHADGLYRNHRDYETPNGVQRNSFIDTRSGALGASLVGDAGFVGISFSRHENAYGNPGEPGDPEAGEPGVFLDVEQNRVEAKAGMDREFGWFNGLRASVASTDYQHTEFQGEEIGTRFASEADEGRIELTHGARGGWIGAIGVQAFDRTFEAIGEEAFVPRTQTSSVGVFVTEQRTWDAFQLDLGARIDQIKSDPDGLDGREFTPVSLSLGALYNFSDAWRLSFNLDRAERAPAEEELFADGPHVATASFEIGDSTLTEERADQFEIGLHYHGERIDAKVSAYATRFDGFVYLAETGLSAPAEPGEEPLPIRQWTQADADFRGIEGEIIATAFEADAGKFDVRVFGDHVRAELNEGGNLPRIAPSRVGGELRWTADAWRASIGATRYFEQDDVADGETPTDGYTLVDAHFAYHVDSESLGWELFLDGTNLTNETARVHTSFLKDTVVLPGRGVAAGIRVFF